jgi:ferredoxin
MAYKITELCDGCTACKRMCPVEAISGERKNLHIINEKRCIECGVCGWICPVGAVIDENGVQVGRIPRKQWPKPVIQKELCTACAICVEICNKNALTITYPVHKGDLNVYAILSNEKACVGCGLCSLYCPMEAIQMEVRHD